jgi:TatD DNase family protein
MNRGYMLVDSHCHLNFPEFKEDLDAVIKRAEEAGVKTFLTINTSLDESEQIQEIADRYPNVYCTVGAHPHDAADHVYKDVYDDLIRLAQHSKVVGIGETGLDYYYNNSPRLEQIESFKTHIKASIELGLPLIIHTRDADEDTLPCLREFPKAKGVFHCFSGGMELAKTALDLGFYISFSGIITFKKADELREVAKFAPMDRVLVETDSPFLAPIPHRGERNEPAYTRITAMKLAEIKEISLEEVSKLTTRNFFQLFDRCQIG